MEKFHENKNTSRQTNRSTRYQTDNNYRSHIVGCAVILLENRRTAFRWTRAFITEGENQLKVFIKRIQTREFD